MIVLMAPGPSATLADAELCAGLPIAAVGNAFSLIDSPAFIAAADRAWWRNYPEALKVDCPRFTMSEVREVERVHIPQLGSVCNSGVLALEVAVRLGHKRIILLGFDMQGSHYFGQYTNGLRNTTPSQRQQHFRQYDQWARMNKGVEVINCTRNSALTCFPKASLESVLETCVSESSADQAGPGGTVCEGPEAPRLQGHHGRDGQARSPRPARNVGKDRPRKPLRPRV